MRDDSPDYYHRLFSTCEILPEWKARVASTWDHISAVRSMYMGYSRCWPILAVVHNRECDNSPLGNLVNGEPWNETTIMTPQNFGPHKSLAESIQAAIDFGHKFLGNDLATLRDIEAWNGFGYAEYGLNSPYLWAGSQHGKGVGKFVEELDEHGRPCSHLDRTRVDGQIGAAVLLREFWNRIECK